MGSIGVLCHTDDSLLERFGERTSKNSKEHQRTEETLGGSNIWEAPSTTEVRRLHMQQSSEKQLTVGGPTQTCGPD